MPEYSILTLLAVSAVVAVELFWLRTGLFRSAQYWLAIAIVVFFQVWVDGWLTKLSDPIVLYGPEHHVGVRFPWDIPIEDFGFGWAMVTLTLLVWVHAGRRRRSADRGAERTRSTRSAGAPTEHDPPTEAS